MTFQLLLGLCIGFGLCTLGYIIVPSTWLGQNDARYTAILVCLALCLSFGVMAVFV